MLDPRALGAVPQGGVVQAERVGAERRGERLHPAEARKGRPKRRHLRRERTVRADGARRSHQQRLDDGHHRLVVGVRLVELEHRELGIVRPVDPLIPEVVPDLVHPLEPPDDQPLQVQLVGDPQEERHVQRVVVRDERARRGPAVQRLEHRGLHLEVVALVEEGADRRDHARPRAEERAHLGVDGQVGVALPVPLLRVAEPGMSDDPPVDHLLLAERERPERLGEQLDRIDADRHLAGPRAEERPLDADHVADVDQRRERVPRVPELVLPEVELDAAALVPEVREGRLAVRAPRHRPARDADGRPLLEPPQQRREVGRPVAPVERVRERWDPRRFERLELLATSAEHEVEFVAHRASSVELPALRNASMNGSMSPSMTFCTSGILSSVRWSFTIV